MALEMIGPAVAEAEDEMRSVETHQSRLLQPRQRLVVALDKSSPDDAQKLVDALGENVGVFKIGLELAVNGGFTFAETLLKQKHEVFLDLKMLDIPNTIRKSVANVARKGHHFLTVHAIDRKTADAAVEGRNSVRSKLKLLAVTVLSSLEENDLREQGISSEDPQSLGVRRAIMAFHSGFDGVIASGHEARAIRKATSPEFIIKVPGIRLSGTPTNDQVRVMTPRQAMEAGATYLVVGRPIADSDDPSRVARQIIDEIKLATTR